MTPPGVLAIAIYDVGPAAATDSLHRHAVRVTRGILVCTCLAPSRKSNSSSGCKRSTAHPEPNVGGRRQRARVVQLANRSSPAASQFTQPARSGYSRHYAIVKLFGNCADSRAKGRSIEPTFYRIDVRVSLAWFGHVVPLLRSRRACGARRDCPAAALRSLWRNGGCGAGRFGRCAGDCFTGGASQSSTSGRAAAPAGAGRGVAVACRFRAA